MKKMSETILFFGSGPVAAKSLELLAEDFLIEAVVTKPRAPHHRGSVPVLEISEQLDIKVHTVTNKQELSELIKEERFASHLGVLIDFGIIVSQDVIDYFPLGIVNSHFSLLPKWRGADPITFAILNGERETGISLMLLVAAMDEGPLLAQAPFSLDSDMTTPELTDRLIELSHQCLVNILPLYVEGKIQPANQTKVTIAADPAPTYSRKLTKADGLIDWKAPAGQIEREIRAFIEWPKSRTTLANNELIITKARVVNEPAKPGEIKINASRLVIGCGEQSLEILRLKPVGKAEMSAQAFLAGYKII